MAAAHGGTIDLLLADVIMPKMSGTEVAEQLRALRPELRVLYTSGYTADMLIHHGMAASDPALLPKPFSLSLLAERVRRCLDGWRLRTASGYERVARQEKPPLAVRTVTPRNPAASSLAPKVDGSTG